jgi:chromosome segregation ATPase
MELIMPDREALWNKARDLLVIIVIPVSIWITTSIFELENKTLLIDEDIKQVDSQVAGLHKEEKSLGIRLQGVEKIAPEVSRAQQDLITLQRKYESLDTRGDSLEVKVTRVEAKMESMDVNIKEIKVMVQTLVNK